MTADDRDLSSLVDEINRIEAEAERYGWEPASHAHHAKLVTAMATKLAHQTLKSLGIAPKENRP